MLLNKMFLQIARKVGKIMCKQKGKCRIFSPFVWGCYCLNIVNVVTQDGFGKQGFNRLRYSQTWRDEYNSLATKLVSSIKMRMSKPAIS